MIQTYRSHVPDERLHLHILLTRVNVIHPHENNGNQIDFMFEGLVKAGKNKQNVSSICIVNPHDVL